MTEKLRKTLKNISIVLLILNIVLTLFLGYNAYLVFNYNTSVFRPNWYVTEIDGYTSDFKAVEEYKTHEEAMLDYYSLEADRLEISIGEYSRSKYYSKLGAYCNSLYSTAADLPHNTEYKQYGERYEAINRQYLDIWYNCLKEDTEPKSIAEHIGALRSAVDYGYKFYNGEITFDEYETEVTKLCKDLSYHI